MKVETSISTDSNDNYGLQYLFAFVVILLLLTYTSYYLMQNYYSKSFMEFDMGGKKVYFLESNTLQKVYKKNGMEYGEYLKRKDYFKELVTENDYGFKVIGVDKLPTIEKDAKLFVIDMMALSKQEIDAIDSFVSGGGKLFFNFTSGFLDAHSVYQEDNLVSRISTLELNSDYNMVTFDKNTTAYLSTKLLSPLSRYMQEGDALDIVLYDPLPLFDTPKNVAVDGYITNWLQTSYLKVSQNKALPQSQSGALWHGYKGSGKWVYFSFPSYSFFEMQTHEYANLIKGVLEFLDASISVMPYPYIDAKNAVFVSEDTEYKYENIQKFYNIAQKYTFPVTAFCVASIAKEHKKLMQDISKSEYFEIGAHGYSHKKIVGESDAVYEKESKGAAEVLHELTQKDIVGFRPPREEIDEKLTQSLEDAGFKYILGAGSNRLSPSWHGDIMVIPRHGTDDYSYLINLDWNSSKILEQIKTEVNVIAALNGIYSLSTHTHLMSFGSNIKITEDFFKYIKQHKKFAPMNGWMVYKRVAQRKKISLETSSTLKNFVIKISNRNKTILKHVHYQLYVDSGVKIKNIQSEIIGVKTTLMQESANLYTLEVEKINPQSQMVLFVAYEKSS